MRNPDESLITLTVIIRRYVKHGMQFASSLLASEVTAQGAEGG
jgi:hypothetical protein